MQTCPVLSIILLIEGNVFFVLSKKSIFVLKIKNVTLMKYFIISTKNIYVLAELQCILFIGKDLSIYDH